MAPWRRGMRNRGSRFERGNGWRGGRRGRGRPCSNNAERSSNGNGERPSRPEDTYEQEEARADYIAWKRIIKTPPRQHDEKTVDRLWNGALPILNGGEREWKQMLPRDLVHEESFGLEHVGTLLAMRTSVGGPGAFVQLIRPFVLVITHWAFLDCLSVDTFVGALYTFIGGTNGTRAVPFFQNLCWTLVSVHVDKIFMTAASTIDTTLVAVSTALRELLRREPRARFNDDLPTLIDTWKTPCR
ncbi:hypothetical protein A1O1_09060 [Capronia coronata CBS 617.96]|uniref:Uncharacterized protein n=1 Tax=Capronia coronata CBS 617.96 TaxID=1182541 RepID=W9Y8C3_9EURO|nr:uncharacterized protein A1O1_09060 [Capronia coronata CBS 617.96]EXJ78659.1 hypothetical protein A1O1_09060 [Capronia coronata CBS 617.96]